jgi:hypothetical protein
VFRVDSESDQELSGNYDIGEYSLRPCKTPEKYSMLWDWHFLLLFPFEGIAEEDKARAYFQNHEIASMKAKVFVSWFVCATRTWARLSSITFGNAMFAHGNTMKTFEKEKFNEDLLENQDWGLIRNAKIGQFEVIKRPELEEHGRTPSEPIRIPSDFPSLTRKLFGLEKRLKERFLNACFSYQFARENWIAYPTVSVLALVSSVESIMESEITSQFCEDAGKPCRQKMEVMKKFKMFFERTLANPLPTDLAQFLEKIYSKRSKYVHKALLDGYGIRGIYDYGHTKEAMKADAEARLLERLVNAALIEWLIKI